MFITANFKKITAIEEAEVEVLKSEAKALRQQEVDATISKMNTVTVTLNSLSEKKHIHDGGLPCL